MWHSDRGRDAELLEPEPLPTWDAATDDELAALDALGKAGEWELGGRTLKLTNLDKVLFPAGPDGEPVTKRDLVRHHAAMAPAMLPYLYDRPINMHRYPRSEEHTSELQSLMRISYAVFCLNKKNT